MILFADGTKRKVAPNSPPGIKMPLMEMNSTGGKKEDFSSITIPAGESHSTSTVGPFTPNSKPTASFP